MKIVGEDRDDHSHFVLLNLLLDTYLLALDPPVLRGKNQEYHLWPLP